MWRERVAVKAEIVGSSLTIWHNIFLLYAYDFVCKWNRQNAETNIYTHEICAVWSNSVLVILIFYDCYEQYLECLSFKAGCAGSSESTLVKMPYCWESHVKVQIWACARDFNTYRAFTLKTQMKAQTKHLRQCMRFPTMWFVRPTPQSDQSLC